LIIILLIKYCSINAECRHGECICHPGYSGDGYECNLYCAQNYIWNNDRCVKISTEEESEVHPFCTNQGCTCASGYKLIQYSYGDICQLIEEDNESYNGEVDEKGALLRYIHLINQNLLTKSQYLQFLATLNLIVVPSLTVYGTKIIYNMNVFVIQIMMVMDMFVLKKNYLA